MPKSDVDCARIVKDIRKEYDDIIWVSASIRGTRLIIQVKENEDSLPVVNKTEEEKEQEAKENATDIVADQDCVITDIVPRKGIAMVKEGDQVKKGDILISGQVPVNDDAGETIRIPVPRVRCGYPGTDGHFLRGQPGSHVSGKGIFGRTEGRILY